MNVSESIIIFTKDRQDVLKQTLISIEKNNIRTYVIDDSFQAKNKIVTRKLVASFSNVFYIGQDEFIEFVRLNKIDTNNCKSIIRQVGNIEWNLGYARNFALLYSKAYHIDKVLFIDDDINVGSENLILNSFKFLDQYDFVGANISGMIDDSIIGHVSTELGIIDSDNRMLSGGFLAFKPQKIRRPFMNVYNEDWIWLFLHTKESKYLQTDEVFQKYSDPYLNYKKKAIFQEIGEIIILGILKVKEKNRFYLLMEDGFWINILKERRFYLNELYGYALNKRKIELKQLIKWVIGEHKEINSTIFTKRFVTYFDDENYFKNLYNSI